MIKNWLKTHRKQVTVHGVILFCYVLYVVFLADPLFDKFDTQEVIPGEAKPVQLTIPDETGDIRYWVDLFDVGTRQIEVMGWAFIYGHSSDNTDIYLILKSKVNTYAFKAVSQLKPGITKVYQELGLNLDWSGFYCIIPLRKLELGKYRLGLYITKGDIQALRYTDKEFVK